MEFDVEELSYFELYSFLTSWVAPRPVAWVSTLSKEGVINLASFSFFNLVCDQPPVVMLSISKRDDGTRKNTSQNILDVGEFVINFLELKLVKKAKLTSEEAKKLEVAKVTPEKSKRVKPPRVKECPASFECKLLEHRELYDYDLIFGEVVFIVIRKERDYRVGMWVDGFCRCQL